MITASGQDIYFNTGAALTPADGDDLGDVYDARIDGGFSFAPPASCSGEACQPPPPVSPPHADLAEPTGLTARATSNPRPCPKGKVAKGNKCVKKKKQTKRHKHKKPGKKAAPKQGGGK